ncbi:MAG: sugar kinase [Candidatus Hydrogenedentes bacterium]|nr:sugar kinase [Candidatus Hydrogenedentota bacterium]
MHITVVGSVALDTVETPWGKNEDGLGGAAVYFALAAANFSPVHLVGVVGGDFPDRHLQLLAAKGIDLTGLERAPGKTFRWAGRYHADVNQRDTLDTQLNVFENFRPNVPEAARSADFLFLGNIHPALQADVLAQTRPRFVAMDTMNLWIATTPDALRAVLREVDALIINDAEARQLTGEANVVAAARGVQALGPEIVVVKKGEHGAMLFDATREVFVIPALPLDTVVDPTGAGDSFAGGFLGAVAQAGDTSPATLRRAVAYGTVVASFTCEAFGPARLADITPPDIQERLEVLRRLSAF